jgi:putative molybdopterin biosynthesis protein
LTRETTVTTEQDQFLRILSRDEADLAFRAALSPKPLGKEAVPLAGLLGRVLAEDIRAPIDTPPFDRSVVDGYAIRADETREASDSRSVILTLNPETLSCGQVPRLAVERGFATTIATGAPMPRGADAVVMLENVEPIGEGRIAIRKGHAPGQNIAYAGSDIARGQTVLYRGAMITARDIAVLAAIGLAEAMVWRRPRIAVLSTGDELVAPGETLRPAGVYDSNGPVIAAALSENGCEAVPFGIIPDDLAHLGQAMRIALFECDGLVLSGGTSKGAGDLTYRLIGELGAPGIIAHGVALKPGKPLCLAVCDGKPVVALPGFPTSAMFTFHDLVAPVFRQMAGLPPRESADVTARVPLRLPSELGRREFVMVALSEGADGIVANPVGKGSGAVTAFSQADGFLSIDALADHLPAGTITGVTLFSRGHRIPDFTIIGSHCTGLDLVVSRLNNQGIRVRILPIGSLGGVAALKRGECDIAPVHVLDVTSNSYNCALLTDHTRLIAGWRRMQGLQFRREDTHFVGKSIDDCALEVLRNPELLMVNRNAGAGTRVLIDQLLKGARPPGYSNQPRSHNAVAAAIAQGRADWGVAIKQVADANDLGFLPIADEHFDFLVSTTPRRPEIIVAFEAALGAAANDLREAGFMPA